MVLNLQGGTRYYPATAVADGLLTTEDYEKLQTAYDMQTIYTVIHYYRTTAQSIANITTTAIVLDGAAIDYPGGIFDGTSTFTIPAAYAGVWLWGGHVQFNAAAGGGRRNAGLLVNGASRAAAEAGVGAATYTSPHTVELLNLTAGDTVKLYAYQDSGGALNTLTGIAAVGIWGIWLHGAV